MFERHKVNPIWQRKGRLPVLLSAGVLLAFALAKLTSLVGILSGVWEARILLGNTSPLMIFGLAICEVLAAILLICCLSIKTGSVLASGIGVAFLVYRLYHGATKCPCTGGLMSISTSLDAHEENVLLSAAIGLLLLGLWGWVSATSPNLRVSFRSASLSYFGYAPAAITAAALLTLAFYAPLSDALIIGGDDVFELCKAQLLHRRPELADRLYNDQPWLHTILISFLFELFGENAAIPRALNLGCTLVIVLAGFRLLGRDTGVLERLLLPAFFLTSTQVLTLATSAMLEIPAFATALCAVSITLNSGAPSSSWRPFVAGLLLAAAANIKLTALIVLPAWAVAIWFGRREVATIRWILFWLLGVVTAGLLIAWISPTFAVQDLWLRHWRVRQITYVMGELPPIWGHVVNDVTIFLALVAGVWCLVTRGFRRAPGLLFSVVWLLTAGLIHVFHRPWWGFYSLHFHVPVAILAAAGAAQIVRCALTGLLESNDANGECQVDGVASRPDRNIRYKTGLNLAIVATIVIVTGWFGYRLPATVEQLRRIASAETAKANFFISEIRKYAQRASWLYSTDNEIIFHSGILQPPELVLVTYKRFALQEINQEAVLRIVMSYSPDVLLLGTSGELSSLSFRTWLEQSRYVKVLWTNDRELWVAESLAPDVVRSPQELVRDLRL